MDITLTNLADIPVVLDGTPATGEDGGSPIRKKAADKKYGILLENAIVSQYAKIEVKTPEKQTHVNIVIYDNVGNIVFEASERSDTFVWNLTNRAGRIVANGSYSIVVESKGVSGKIYRYRAKLGVKR
jgi:flagellar hook assembly protein FlgD